VLLANIAPALVAKMGWPYLVHGEVQYAMRIWACSLLSFVGILVSPTTEHDLVY
jgi:battenin